MIVTAKLEREFLFKQNQKVIKLADPSPGFTPQQVMNFYSGTYPILTTATLEGPNIKEDKLQYSFNSSLGTKG
ncbi:PRTRC system protein C [Pedobacter sp. MC2016-24]|uniref:PRTRC system protein C n=1 Tax=Pedobacter sp. MC2016-24 TaxID=2780090 RepID=UPI001881E348|nr:PRTRC system protein C [Pedobacter sp. MC2016-24]MBE9599863.1 PRTRC system protein C [Pedobacter sp. MC2016-24]